MSTYHPEVLPARKVIPDPGDVTFEFNRNYLCINPNAALGPPTWRVSEPDEMPCGDGINIPPPPDTAERYTLTECTAVSSSQLPRQ